MARPHGHQQVVIGGALGPALTQPGEIRSLKQRVIGQRHQHGAGRVLQGLQAGAQRAAGPRIRIGVGGAAPAAQPCQRLALRQRGLHLSRMVAQHHRHLGHAGLAQQTHGAHHQRFAVAPQQRLGPVAHAPPGAGGHDDGRQRRHRLGRAHPTPQADSAAAWVWAFLT